MTLSTEPGRASSDDGITLRRPRAEDGAAIWRLVADCAPLDRNSLYCNLLQCTHFAGTCLVAERDGAPVGWVSGYRLPEDPATLFVWQVAVAPALAGRGLGARLLDALLARPACRGVERLATTITAGNAASWGLFSAFARRQGGTLARRPHFLRDTHLAGRHDSEHLVTIRLPGRDHAGVPAGGEVRTDAGTATDRDAA